jgi:hypothetical protein
MSPRIRARENSRALIVSTGEIMNKVQIITMGASDDKLVSIRGTIGEVAMRFFAARLLGASADGFMVELHDTGEALRVFDGWGEMCMIEAKTDGAVTMSAQQTEMVGAIAGGSVKVMETLSQELGQRTSSHYYTINTDEFLEALNRARIQLLQTDQLLQRTSKVVTMQHGYDPVAKMYYCSVVDEIIGWWCGGSGG